MKNLAWCLAVAVALQLIAGGDALCCLPQTYKYSTSLSSRKLEKSMCGDCSKPNPFCNHRGSCNVLGCDCEGVCKVGACFEEFFKRDVRSLDESDVMRRSTADDVIRDADVDGDGRMSLEEAGLHLGVSAHQDRKSLRDLDTDGDNFLSAAEIDSPN